MLRILILEDDREIAKHLSRLLRTEGYDVICAENTEAALTILFEKRFDLALLDISLPDGNGFSVCTEIKDRYGLPVIFVSASGDEASVVTGLNMGADDYVTKPFRPRELLARISAALRKNGNRTELSVGGLEVNTASGIVKKNGKEVTLSPLDYRLLLAFLNNPGSIIPRERLMDELWEAGGDYVTNNTLTVYIKRLRERIEDDPAAPQIILTVRGIGYRLGDGYAVE